MITVAIPHIPPRELYLSRAIASVSLQTLPAEAVAVAMDVGRQGAGPTRQRALEMVKTDWVAFLDDDDFFAEDHLKLLMAHAMDTGADYVYSWFTVIGGTDPFPGVFQRPFDPEHPVQTTITTLVRTELALEARFDHEIDESATVDGQRWGEDYTFTCRVLELGGTISHLPVRTWFWDHDSGNTSGKPVW